MKANKKIVNTSFICLGTNQGDREKNLKTALKEIEKFCKIKKKSSIYETEPVEYKNQGEFLNMIIEIKTDISPTTLLKNLQKIENKMGRIREIKNGPRIIDLDILFYEDKIINTQNLKIPHPKLHERKFVLIPLEEIAPNKIHPKIKKDIRTILKNLKNSKKVKLWT
jgi:2-amino-4-hydroxy-6-hydroxymethyldihydropteridine diphosphokinase